MRYQASACALKAGVDQLTQGPAEMGRRRHPSELDRTRPDRRSPKACQPAPPGKEETAIATCELDREQLTEDFVIFSPRGLTNLP
jgi:hypothetical protein